MNAQQHQYRPAQHQQLAPVFFAMVGGICGSVLATIVAAELHAPPLLRLVAAALGAAIPPLISAAGPYQWLRLSAGVMVTLVALAITHGGVQLFSVATGGAQPGVVRLM